MRFALAAILLYGASFSVVFAEVVITEIMYDLPGSDSGREWVEIQNTGEEAVDLSDWRFNDGSNHLLVISDEKGGQGSLTIDAGGYAVLASDAVQFLSEYAGFSGTVIDTVMSLGQQDDRTYTLSMIRPDGSVESSVSYTISLGANGDGNSLQRVGGNFTPGTPTPGAANSGQQISPEEQEDGGNGDTTATNPSSGGGSTSSSAPPLVTERIYADAGEDRVVIVGADSVFEGEGLGIKKEPLGESARYLWNFGNGKTAEGKNILHHYEYPGTYVVMLTVASGKLSATDRITVRAVPSEIVISEVNEKFIVLKNNGSHEIDISHWQLNAEGTRFRIPEGTIVLPKNKITFSETITGLAIGNPSQVALLYPNGTKAGVYEPIEPAAAEQEITAPKQTVAAPSPAASPAPSEKVVAVPVKSEISDEAENSAEEQVAAVADVVPNNSDMSLYKWLLALLGVVGVGTAAAIIFRRERREGEIEIID